MIIQNAYIITMAGNRYDNGYVQVKNGKISAVGVMADCPKPRKTKGVQEEVIDAAGRILLPGFVDAHCHIGVFGDSIGFEGDDGNEMTDPVTPHLRALDAIHHQDRCFSDAVKAGVTTAVTGPGSANVFGGQFAAMKTVGRTADEMVFREPCALKIAFGENPKSVYHEKHQAPSTRMATAALLREQFFKAKEYQEALDKHIKDPDDNDKPEYDMKLEALLPVLRGELVVKAHAHRADDIVTALRIKKEFKLDMTIDHCTEGWMMADVLKEAGVDVILGPLLTDRSKVELKNMNIAGPGIMARAGLPIAIMSDHPCIPVQYLLMSAVVAAKEGLDRETALAAITINAAKSCRIQDRVGSIELGKDADFVLFDRDPMDIHARVEMTIIDGKVVYRRELDSI